MPKVKVNYKNLPKDAEVEVPYLGKFKNGSTGDVTQAKWDRFKKNWPGADAVEGDSLELSTASAEESTKAHKTATEDEQKEDAEAGTDSTSKTTSGGSSKKKEG